MSDPPPRSVDGDAACRRLPREDTGISELCLGCGFSACQCSRADKIRALRAEGLTLRAIGDRLGVSKSVVNRALYPRVRAYEKEYNRDRYYTANCQMCGRPCTFNRHAKRARGRWCVDCYRAHRKEALRA